MIFHRAYVSYHSSGITGMTKELLNPKITVSFRLFTIHETRFLHVCILPATVLDHHLTRTRNPVKEALVELNRDQVPRYSGNFGGRIRQPCGSRIAGLQDSRTADCRTPLSGTYLHHTWVEWSILRYLGGI